jgi:DNA-binding winged helix-turn-helix (wHTH) protein
MSNETKHLYEFGPYRLDPGRKLLLRNGDLVALTSKALEILLVLVERSEHVVTKDELMKEVWPASSKRPTLRSTFQWCAKPSARLRKIIAIS